MNIKLPELGEGIESVEVTDILVSEGNTVKKDDIIIVVESDKASMEIPSKVDGEIIKINITKGDEIKPGDLILELNDSTIDQPTAKTENNSLNDGASESVINDDITNKVKTENNSLNNNASESVVNDGINNEVKTENINSNNSNSLNVDNNFEPIRQPFTKQQDINSGIVVATPSVRKFARELGCDLSKVYGSAKNGRITKDDVLNFVKNYQSDIVEQDDRNLENMKLEDDNGNLYHDSNEKNIKPMTTSHVDSVTNDSISVDDNKLLKYGPIEKVLFNKIRTLTAKKMVDSWNTIPHVTHFDEIEIDHILDLKKDIELATGAKKVSILTFISRALIDSIVKMEKFNSIADMKNNILIVKKYVNLGIAVDTSNGLVVPNIKNAEKLSIKELNDSIIDISQKARDRNLSPSDMMEGSFTISSLGGIGGRYFTPIINKPEVAIMGISRTFKKVYLNHNKNPYEVNILPFSISYDHRVIDGAEAAKFCNLFKNNLKNLSING